MVLGFSMIYSCSFLVILWSIYTNIKVLFIDNGVMCVFKAWGQFRSQNPGCVASPWPRGRGRTPTDG